MMYSSPFRKTLFTSLVAVLITIASWSIPVVSAAELLCGIDRLEVSCCKELSGLRVGLITNAVGVTRHGEANYALLLRNGVDVKFLMAPEHGFAVNVEAGKKVGSAFVADMLPVFSLYGESKKPAIEQLRQIDVLVFDLQDIGTRCYTYISTMNNAMAACEQAGTPFMVLDRPNPIAPLAQSGFMVQPGYESFVGAVDVPFIHGMTVGEIALLLKQQRYKKLDLRVIPMQGYVRQKFGDEQDGFTFRTPSPNIKNVETAIVYPATVFLEATAVSEGRGTDAPFLQFGAPFIKSEELLNAVKSYNLMGVSFAQVEFTSRFRKFSGQVCYGLKLTVTDRRTFDPFRTATALLLELQRLYPEKTGICNGRYFFDKLAGTPLFSQMIIQQQPIDTIIAESRRQVEQFRVSMLAAPLLYQ